MPITYDKFFRITNCDIVIFLEDDFMFENNKESIFYGVTRLNHCTRERMYAELKESGADFTDRLQKYSSIADGCLELVDWENEIPRDDIETLFAVVKRIYKENDATGESLQEIYESIDIKDLLKFQPILNKYGIGVKIPNYFEQIFNEYIYRKGEWKKYKIYTDFNAKMKRSFLKDVNEYSQSDKTIVCIIDNQLGEEQRASEILQELEKMNEDGRKNIVAAILSSKGREEKISDKIFAEYVSKGGPDNLQIALAKSAYSLLLFKLKSIYQKILEKSFNEAIVNKDIAYYFAKMASTEGVTNYKVVTDWINLLFQYKLNVNEEIYDIIRLTQLMDILNDEDVQYSEEMQKLNTFEAFDLNVNQYYQPPASGDIFKDNKGNYYVLVGQDCDLMISQTRKGKNAVSELVKAYVDEQKEIEKYNKNLEYICVNNFREKDLEQPKGLKIKYSSREYLDNVIILLCCFNKDGKCAIKLGEKLDPLVQDMIPSYFCDIYEKLQQFFENIDELKQTIGDKINAILVSEFSPRLTSVLEYENVSDNYIVYPYKRVGRLNRNYMLYLYKLFLEYRGRHSFDGINLTRHASVTVPVVGNINAGIQIEVILSTNREENRKHWYKKLDWYVYPRDLEQVIKEVFEQDIHIKSSDLLILTESKNEIECIENKKIFLTKTKNGAELELK